MRYEYKIIHTANEMSASQLNILNNVGWELVTVTFIESMFSYYMRKAKK